MDTSHPIEQPSEAVDAKGRGSERLNFFLGTTIDIAGRTPLPARVRNLSGGGMMVETTAEPAADPVRGDRLVAELRNIGRVKGEIAWADGRRFGIKFDREIDPEQARKPVGSGQAASDYAKPALAPGWAFSHGDRPKGR